MIFFLIYEKTPTSFAGLIGVLDVTKQTFLPIFEPLDRYSNGTPNGGSNRGPNVKQLNGGSNV